MKKILLSTTLLIATAGVAAAEVTLSGSGRFGIVSNNNVAATKSSTISARLRFNVDAKFEADNGVTYGGRIRFQHSTGSTGAAFSPAMLYVETNGFRVEVGNANSAYDSVALMYNSELGYRSASFGDPQGSFYGFSSGPYRATVAATPAIPAIPAVPPVIGPPPVPGVPAVPAVAAVAAVPGEENRVGIYVAYSFSNVNLKASYIQTDQTQKNKTATSEDESSVAVDATFGQITVAAAIAQNAGGIRDNDLTFVGAAYAFSDVGNVGLNFNDNGAFNTTTLYGNYKFGATTVGAYLTDSDVAGQDTAYGIGASYDLGGATLAGSYHSGFAANTDYLDLGVNFSF